MVRRYEDFCVFLPIWHLKLFAVNAFVRLFKCRFCKASRNGTLLPQFLLATSLNTFFINKESCWHSPPPYTIQVSNCTHDHILSYVAKKMFLFFSSSTSSWSLKSKSAFRLILLPEIINNPYAHPFLPFMCNLLMFCLVVVRWLCDKPSTLLDGSRIIEKKLSLYMIYTDLRLYFTNSRWITIYVSVP